jgi:hypothetical protein
VQRTGRPVEPLEGLQCDGVADDAEHFVRGDESGPRLGSQLSGELDAGADDRQRTGSGY